MRINFRSIRLNNDFGACFAIGWQDKEKVRKSKKSIRQKVKSHLVSN